jgi:capsular polysaccharide biosynthesis protein
MLNESTALAVMDKVGLDYSVIRPGLEPLEKTIRTLMNASAIIGPTGGAMFHQVWAKNLSLLLELKPQQYQSMSESEELAGIFGYEYIESPTIPDSLGFWSNCDQVIDLLEFNQCIKFLKSQI